MKKRVSFLLVLLVATLTGFSQGLKLIIPRGHASAVKRITTDPQGRFLYSAEENQVIMWDLQRKKQLHSFVCTKDVRGLSLNKDATLLLITCGSSVNCYNTVSGALIYHLSKGGGVTGGIFSSDESKIIIGSFEKFELIDLSSGKSIGTYGSANYGNDIVDMALIDNGTKLATTGEKMWNIYDLSTMREVFKMTFEDHGKAIIIPSQNRIVVGGIFTFCYDLLTGQKIANFPHVVVNRFIMSSGGKFMAIYGDNSGSSNMQNGESYLQIYNTATFKLEKSYDHLKFPSIEPAFFPEGTNNLYLSNNNEITTFNYITGKKESVYTGLIANWMLDGKGSVMLDNLWNNGQKKYNQKDELLHIITEGSNLKTLDFKRMAASRHTALDGKQIGDVSESGDTITISEGLKVKSYDVRYGLKLLTTKDKPFRMPDNEVVMQFSGKDGKTIYYLKETPEGDVMFRMNIQTKQKEKLFAFNSRLGSYQILPDKDFLTGFETGYQKKIAGVWDLASGKRLFSKEMVSDKPDKTFGNNYAIAMSGDKKRAMLYHDHLFDLYDLSTGNLLSSAVQAPDSYFPAGVPFETASDDLSLLAVCGPLGYGFRVYDLTGKLLLSQKTAVQTAYFSGNKQLVYALTEDQTVKVWEISSGKLLGTLYLFRDANDYVFLEPYGRFDGSPGGMKQLYYLKARQIITLDAVFEKYYTPNLYQRLLHGEQFNPVDIVLNPAPKVRISYAEAKRNLDVVDDGPPEYQNTTGVAEIIVNATSESEPIDEIRLFHNGKIVTLATRNLLVADDNSPNSTSKKYTVQLLPGENNLRAVALNGQRTESEPDEIRVIYSQTAAPVTNKPAKPATQSALSAVDKNATLHLVVIGINAYKNPSMVLNYALADATAFKTELEKDARSVITNIQTYFVTDDQADKNGILKALSEVQKAAKPNDLFVFYYAGHGVIGRDKEFYLVPNDVTDLKNVNEALTKHGIQAKVLQQFAIDIQAQKQLFILDACQSAGAFEALLTGDAEKQKSIALVSRSTGTHWMAASGAQQYANEFSQLGHGAFTYILLEALKGAAATNKLVTVNGLKNYLQEEVPALMRKYNGTLQYPASYGFGNDFPLELIR